MNPLIWIAAALGAIAVIRRKHLRGDAQRLRTAASDAKTAATQRIAARRGGASDGVDDSAGEAAIDESTGEDVAEKTPAEDGDEGDEGDGESDSGSGQSTTP